MMETFDAIIIGSGQAGNPLIHDLAEAGWKVAMIEREHAGGTCINEGCTPTKTLIASSQAAHEVRRAKELGINVGTIEIDFPKIIARKDEIVRSWSESGEKRIEETKNATLVWGEASFVDKNTIRVEGRAGSTDLHDLRAKYIFINTGGRPAPAKFEGANDIGILDSTSVMNLKSLPEHLVIIGGSYVALEFGQFFRRLGSRVTILEMAPEFLKHEDRDMAEAIQKALTDEGIEILLNTKVKSASKHYDQIHLVTSGASVTATHVLYAAGRVPNTEALHLERAGIATDEHGYITVNERLETNVPNIFALGDVNGGPAFTHISYDDYRIVRDNLLHGASRTTKSRPVPYTMFIDPQFSRVGLSESDAVKQNIPHRVAKMPMSHVARASETGNKTGLLKAIVAHDGKILGAAIFGTEGGEILSMIEIAMRGGLTARDLTEMIFVHPNYSEALNILFAV
ncbi:MAG TPA: mercuric reductase [Candidatus Kapabacteria bacterium]|nr:mercuric reductase [Candidatus Kapabacteria bacterium]